jgi:hypothetical protein
MAGYYLPLVIEEMNGKKRMLALRERSLPYKGLSLVNGTMKVEITYFPNNPVAYSQILGPECGGTTMTGWWKDKFLINPENAPLANRFPAVTAYGQPQSPKGNLVFGNTFASSGVFPGGTQDLQRSSTVRDAFELIKNSGALLKVEWQDVARFGHLVRTNFNEHGGDEIEYEVEFKWTGTTDAQPKVVKGGFKGKSLLDKLIGLVKGLTNALAGLTYAARLYVGKFAGKIAELLNAINGLIQSLVGMLDFKKMGGEMILGIKSSLYAIRDSVRELMALFDGDDNRLNSGRRNQGDTHYGELLMQQIRQILLILAAEAAENLELLEMATARQTMRVYEVKALEGLRDIALKVYGTPDPWRQIMYFNNLSSSFVPGGVELKIPKLGA